MEFSANISVVSEAHKKYNKRENREIKCIVSDMCPYPMFAPGLPDTQKLV